MSDNVLSVQTVEMLVERLSNIEIIVERLSHIQNINLANSENILSMMKMTQVVYLSHKLCSFLRKPSGSISNAYLVKKMIMKYIQDHNLISPHDNNVDLVNPLIIPDQPLKDLFNLEHNETLKLNEIWTKLCDYFTIPF